MRRLFRPGRRDDIANPHALLAPVLARLDRIEHRLDDVAEHIRTLQAGGETPADRPPVDGQPARAVEEALAALEKQVGRSGREQLRANALAEAQLKSLSEAMEMLRAADARRDAEVAALMEQRRDLQAAARLDVVRALLPALDGLDEALRAGRQILAQPEAPPTRRTFWARLRRRPVQPLSGAAPLHAALESWLVGLTYVRQRLLDLLATEGVRPIDAEGQPFDPRLHVAIEVAPADAVPPGTVTAELRRGYLAGDRVLRHSEVAVARA
jgi:molecular chaperone GrpE